MRTASANIEVHRGGVQQESTFTIKATSKAFDILSSGLYSDKIKAIVRELSCNAYDSHVAAGKADTPIEVKLPTYLDMTFYVKDYGLGLSHEGVTKLYTTYFESTKTESDDFIGQLGLGSKSPFSYAATFTVESRFEGMKRIYTCFKNEQGMPAISLMGEEETTEDNGITVSLAVKRDDVDKFSEAARKVFMYFNPKPVIKGHTNWKPYDLKHTIAGTNWKIREADYYARMNDKAYVVQGFVPYPIDVDILAERGLSGAARKLAKTNLDLYVDIGKVEVAASREALSYDVRTIQNLIDVLETAAKEMRTSFQAEFDKCKTTWEAAQTYGKFRDSGSYEFREIFNSMHAQDPFKWMGNPVADKVEIDLSSVSTTVIRTMNMRGGKANNEGTWTPENATKKMPYDISRPGLHILVDTEAKGHSIVAEQFFHSQSNATRVLLIAPTSKKLYNQNEVDRIVRQLGNPPVTKVADLNVVRGGQGTTYKKRQVEEKLVWQGFPEREDRYGRKEKRSTFSRLCWATETVDLEDGGFYVDLERFAVVKNGVLFEEIDEMIDVATSLGIIDDNFKLYGMNERDKKHIADNDEWVEFTSFVANSFTTLNANNALYNRCIYDNVVQQMGRQVNVLFINDWQKQRSLLTEGKFVAFIDKVVELGNNSAQLNSLSISKAIRLLHLTAKIGEEATSMYQDWRDVVNGYEMLSLIYWDTLDQFNLKKVVNYINTVEASKKP